MDVSGEALDLSNTVAFKVEALKVREEFHAFDGLEALVVEVKFFVQLNGAVIHFPFVLEELLNPPFVQSGDTALLVAFAVTV